MLGKCSRRCLSRAIDGVMTTPSTLREFLSSRRAAIDPESLGLPASATQRRSRGLRREEVAALAGVSVHYYARLEQGRVGNVSEEVLTAIANALRLDTLELEHLRALVGATRPQRRASRPVAVRPRPALGALIDALDPVPAFLQGPRMDVLAINRAASILLADFNAMPAGRRNIARWMFQDPEARIRFPRWEEVAAGTAAALRAARDPRMADEALEALVGELSVSSPEFARYWADYRLFQHTHGTKVFYHQSVGELTIHYETLAVGESDGLSITTYTADVGSASDERLGLLLSWHAEAPSSEAARGTVNPGPSVSVPS